MNIKQRIKKIETQTMPEFNPSACRCPAPHWVIGQGKNCKNCGKEISGRAFAPGVECEVIKPKCKEAEIYEH